MGYKNGLGGGWGVDVHILLQQPFFFCQDLNMCLKKHSREGSYCSEIAGITVEEAKSIKLKIR